jgi:hypothetical protein
MEGLIKTFDPLLQAAGRFHEEDEKGTGTFAAAIERTCVGTPLVAAHGSRGQ